MTRKDRMNEQIKQHGINLIKIFHPEVSASLNPTISDFLFASDAVRLAKKVHSLEVKAHKLATDYCNGDNDVTTDNWEVKSDAILDKLDKILNFRSQGIPVFVNGDARGYALKIDDEYVREHSLDIYKDWGGYGILAPEFDGK